MAQAIWRGNIVFGMVSIPVQLYSATEDKDIHFHLLSADGKSRLRRKLYSPETGKDYEYKDTKRGYEIAPDKFLVVTQEELEKLEPEKARNMEISKFVDASEIDPVYFQTPYYIVPTEDGLKAYHLLKKALSEAGRVAIARFVMRDHEYLTAIRPKDSSLVLETLHYADEIRPAGKLPLLDKEVKVDEKEEKLALQLIEALSGKFKAEEYRDEHRERVQELIEKKAKGQAVTFPAEQPARHPKVIDLFDALKQSLEKKGKKPAKAAERPGAARKGGRKKAHAG